MKIIFHHPLPLDPKATSASGIRPQRMLQAFKDLGYEVDLVTGYAQERKSAIKEIKAKIESGVSYDFVYAESSTMPNLMTEKHHLPLHPLLDYGFFRLCNKYNIPIGLFYRDIYWLFEEYGKGMNPIKTWAAKLAYRFDLWVYQKTLCKLYLPSCEMGAYIPLVTEDKFEALPPGHSSPSLAKSGNGKLELFYVGGLSSHYQLHLLFEVLKDMPQISFTLCTREKEWESMKHEYLPLSENIRVIHKSGVEMEEYLKASSMVVLYVKPQEYWEFASPVKLYEYIGFQKPILASEGTLAGAFVKEHNIGWSLPYTKKALQEQLEELSKKPELLSPIQENLAKIENSHTWEARAKQVIKDLVI